jgi:MoCo/4Fe-4S cofactor protein with predicted Tat translocation signal
MDTEFAPESARLAVSGVSRRDFLKMGLGQR